MFVNRYHVSSRNRDIKLLPNENATNHTFTLPVMGRNFLDNTQPRNFQSEPRKFDSKQRTHSIYTHCYIQFPLVGARDNNTFLQLFGQKVVWNIVKWNVAVLKLITRLWTPFYIAQHSVWYKPLYFYIFSNNSVGLPSGSRFSRHSLLSWHI